MTMGQDQPAPFYCPRCGGLMQKLAGSNFYWHADNNHPACEITNLADPKTITPTAAEKQTPIGRTSRNVPRV